MGTFNFGESEITDGVKIIPDNVYDDDDHFGLNEYIETLEDEFKKIRANVEYEANGIVIEISMDSPETKVTSGYYNGVAIDYKSDFYISVSVSAPDDPTILDLDDDADYDNFRNKLNAFKLDSDLLDVITDTLWRGYTDTDVELDTINGEAQTFFEQALRLQSNTIIPESSTVGYCTGIYTPDSIDPELPKGAKKCNVWCEL